MNWLCGTLNDETPFFPSASYREAEEHPLDLLRTLQISSDVLHRYYQSLGCTLGQVDVDAYLHGLAALPHLDRMIVTHSLWELSENLD